MVQSRFSRTVRIASSSFIAGRLIIFVVSFNVHKFFSSDCMASMSISLTG